LTNGPLENYYTNRRGQKRLKVAWTTEYYSRMWGNEPPEVIMT
jgi:hypothetical protein